jgi:carbonic anhydrase
VELVFDRGIGDLFVVRVAGNVCGENETASIEYAVDRLMTPVLVVLGHTNCGVVMGATFGTRARGNVLNLVKHVKPTVEKTRADYPDLHGTKLLNKVIETNVWKTIEDLLARSEICRDAVGRGRVELVGAIYDVESGRVEWLGPHPNEYELVTARR